jgi:predicted dehydrogenase
MSKHILIVGTGSAGKRHARNLHALGCKLSCMDPRQDRLDEIRAEQTNLKAVYTSLEHAFASGNNFDGAVVASPPSVHVDQCLSALQSGVPVLLENPVSPDLSAALKLQAAVQNTGVPFLLGYTWRWWPPLQKVKQLLEDRAVGDLKFVKFTMAAHLADWHPWERYQDFFMASKTLGGGALLDESHWLDLLLWFFGMPEKLFARVEKISDLEIETDDNVDMLVYYADNLRVSLHLDLYARPHEKTIQFVGRDGTLIWEPNLIKIGQEMDPAWKIEEFDYDRNDMFVGVAEEFLNILSGGSIKTCTIEDGVRVMHLIEAARESSVDQKVVKLDKSL